MRKYLIAAAVPMLLATTADAAPKLPAIFHGQWCGEDYEMKRCAEHDGGILIRADGFGADDFGCRVIRLTPQKPSRRDNEYRATFQCIYIGVGTKTTSYRLYYRIGFYDEDHDILFMNEVDSTFTAAPKSDF
jgi:hypothetical protein